MISIKATINEQARAEEQRKIKLENRVTPVIRGLFNQMAKDFENLYIATGSIFDFNIYTDDWSGALKQQYNRVGKEFLTNIRKSDLIRDFIIKQDEDATVEQIATIGAAYTIFAADRAGTQTTFIINTSNLDAIEAVNNARNDLREEDLFNEPTREDVAKEASKNLRKKFRSRVGTIANMETQAPAESAKWIEAAVLSGFPVLPFQQVEDAPITTTKEWAAVGDERVRPAHIAADGQTVRIEQVFTVDNESLRFPGDTSLGASIGNVVNCRCAQVFLKK